MKKLILLAFVAVAATGCSGCNSKQNVKGETVITETVVIPDGHNAQNSLDFAGTYRGTVPCADCDGIKMELKLNKNDTYELKAEYLGNAIKKQLDVKGTFAWDTTGSMITLSGITDGPGKFKVEENQIRLLDENYNIVTGEQKDNYILTKTN